MLYFHLGGIKPGWTHRRQTLLYALFSLMPLPIAIAFYDLFNKLYLSTFNMSNAILHPGPISKCLTEKSI